MKKKMKVKESILHFYFFFIIYIKKSDVLTFGHSLPTKYFKK